MIIERDLAAILRESAGAFRAITLTGPRQSGKTTLCRHLFPNHAYASLEDLVVRERAQLDPMGFLQDFTSGAILDEIQHAPHLLSYLQRIIDEDPEPGRWILTGSQNLELMKEVSQTLAGRTDVAYLLPLCRREATRFPSPPLGLEDTLFTGSFPEVLGNPRMDPVRWYNAYVSTYIERDVRGLIKESNLSTFQRFLRLAAGRAAGILNHNSLGDDCGISAPTAGKWLDLLETGFVVFRLQPFFRNVKKRLTKSPKLYFHDTGLICWLLGIQTPGQLRSHPLRGQIFENWVVSEIVKLRYSKGLVHGLFFYNERNRVETDLVIESPGGFLLLECKSSATPAARMFHSARRVQGHFREMGLDANIAVAYGGDEMQRWSEGTLIPWHSLEAHASLNGMSTGEAPVRNK